MADFKKELEELLNRHSMENGCETPDHILATYLYGCLQAFNDAVNSRENWYGRRRLASKVTTGT